MPRKRKLTRWRFYCPICGETVEKTSTGGWTAVSLHLYLRHRRLFKITQIEETI